MTLSSVQEAEGKLLVPTYDRHPLLLTHGKGVHVYDSEGNAYLDFLSGIGVNALGYSHPAIIKTIAAQAQKLVHTSNLFLSRVHGRAGRAAHQSFRPGSRLFLQQRHGSLRRRAEAGAGLRQPEGEERRAQMAGAGHGKLFPRTHLRLDGDHAHRQIPASRSRR